MAKPLCSYRLVVALALLTATSVPADARSWSTRTFPAPNGGKLVFTIINGNPACASYNGQDCLWGSSFNQIRFNQVQPLVCGANHRAKWGVTGYENPRHWCSLARPRSSGFGDDNVGIPADPE
jgi:hypothetical protein